MQPDHLVDILFAILMLIGGALGKVLWDAVKTLQTDMRAIEVALPTRYVAKDDFNRGVTEIKEMLERISDKLDDKADKAGR